MFVSGSKLPRFFQCPFGRTCRQSGPTRAHLRPTWAHLGLIWALLGATFVPSKIHSRATSRLLGPEATILSEICKNFWRGGAEFDVSFCQDIHQRPCGPLVDVLTKRYTKIPHPRAKSFCRFCLRLLLRAPAAFVGHLRSC